MPLPPAPFVYPILDAGALAGRSAASVARSLVAAGACLLQVHGKDLGSRALCGLVVEVAAAAHRGGALVIVNDRPDIARIAGADGVHVGQDDLAVADVRERVGPELLIGLSTHSPGQLERGLASGADQLSVGPVWQTPTKPGRPAAGLAYVRHAAERARGRPWFAIGGIDRDNVREVIAAGAERIVVARAIADAADPRAAAAALREELGGGEDQP